MRMVKIFMLSAIPFLAGSVANAEAAKPAKPICSNCVELTIKPEGTLVYDPFLGSSVAELPPLPIGRDTCIERDYFDRCLRKASQPKPTDIYVQDPDGRIIRTDAISARIVPGEVATTVVRSPAGSKKPIDD